MKKPRVLDANVILRFLTNDVPEQADRCAELLKRLEAGAEEVWLPELVLADIVWTLEKFYHQPKERIRELLTPLLNLHGLRFTGKRIAKEALRLYAEKNVDWTDAFVAAQMLSRKQGEIYSYDRDFEKIEGITRVEP
ncbi:PIN domain-containing protein [Desulfothermobacter acidiphilus]|uniref:PIN domain-containing protein n=1 Tax=Desulfothermobacter acidiphilus TaxID=1938353 RepID=UPI003F8A0522